MIEQKEFKLISWNPAILLAGLAVSLLATMIVFSNADAIADWGRQNLVTFLGINIMAIIVTLIVMIPPILFFSFSVHLLVLLWLRLKHAVFPKRGD